MKKIFAGILFLCVIAFIIFAIGNFSTQSTAQEKIYVAVEGDARIAVINASNLKIIKEIDLSVSHEGGLLKYYPHNIQVAPDGTSVWVTANSGMHEGHSFLAIPAAQAHGEEERGGDDADQLIVINPQTEAIVARIPIAKGIHLAHVVIDPNGEYAYATAQIESTLYKINAHTYEIESEFQFAKESEPHGLRMSPDGALLYVAFLKGKALGILDTKFQKLKKVPLDGSAVQAGITPNGEVAMVSLYDTKKIALYKVNTGVVKYIQLPDGARGPVQMYATPDSAYVYIADQGYYFDQPENNKVYKVDIRNLSLGMKIETAAPVEIIAGRAPHRVVVSPDGKYTYVANLLSGDVSVIDAVSDTEIAKIPVGKEPNGISIWSKTQG